MPGDPKSDHEDAKHARSRYKIVIPNGKDGLRSFLAESGTYTGDVVLEYWDGILIRDHKFIVTSCLTQPTAAEIYQYNLNGVPGEEPPQARMKNTPTFTTTKHDMTNVPPEIRDGQWTNPLDDKRYKVTHRWGAWGIYAENYMDVYTHQCIDPIVQRYKDKIKSMSNAMKKLFPDEKTISYNGVIDNIAGMEAQITRYIQDCDGQIEEANRILGFPWSGSTQHQIAGIPGSGSTQHQSAMQTGRDMKTMLASLCAV